MSQDQAIILLLKVVLVCGAVSVALFVAEYTWRAAWWKNPIGWALVVKDILLILCLLPSILSLFLQFNRLTSHIAAWIDVGLFGLMTPVMLWRIAVFERVHRDKKAAGPPEDEGASLCCVLSPGGPGPP